MIQCPINRNEADQSFTNAMTRPAIYREFQFTKVDQNLGCTRMENEPNLVSRNNKRTLASAHRTTNRIEFVELRWKKGKNKSVIPISRLIETNGSELESAGLSQRLNVIRFRLNTLLTESRNSGEK